MFLLTEATLFFLDLALKSRVRDKEIRLSSVVQTWVDGVAAATTSDSAGHAHATMGTSSTLYPRPPIHLSSTVGQTLPIVSGRNVPSGTTPKAAIDPFQTFSLSCIGETTARYHAEASVAPSALKRKIDDADMLSDVQLDGSGDHDMDITQYSSKVANVASSAKRSRTHTRSMISTGAIIDSPMFLSQQGSVPSLSASPKRRTSAACRPTRPELPRRRVDSEGCMIAAITKCSVPVIRHLPVPLDQRWSHSFISTAILWYSVQDNIWNVPEVELASALQCIFNVVYPERYYKITPACSVFAIALRRINEWRSSFGSSALAMILHFFSTLEDNDIHHSAEFLATNYRFLCEDPDASEPTKMFRSAFLTVLIATTHLGDISAYVNVPGWDTRAMATGKGGEGVVAIASAAVERAIKFFYDGTLDVDRVLAEMAVRQNTSMNTKAVLEALAAHDTLAFSSANWSSQTATYREAVREHGSDFVQAIFAAARQRRATTLIDPDEGEVCASAAVHDPRAFL